MLLDGGEKRVAVGVVPVCRSITHADGALDVAHDDGVGSAGASEFDGLLEQRLTQIAVVIRARCHVDQSYIGARHRG